jgi:ATP-dependent DNA helicase RecG
MRPPLLDPLFAALTSLPGIGPRLDEAVRAPARRDGPRAIDLLFHLPAGTIDRRARPEIARCRGRRYLDTVVTIA